MQRKTVIFQIEKGNKIISEFSENITILFLKIYIRDRTNIKNFDLYFKRNLIKNNAMPLYKFFHHKKEKSITFFLKIKNDTNKNNIKLKSTNKENVNIYTNRNKLKNKQTIKSYEEEISYVKEKNNELINNINKYKENINECVMKENKNKEKYLSIENLLNKQKEVIQMLRNEINDANIKYKDLKHKSVEKENRIKENQLKYTKSNSNFSIIKHPKPKRCLSVESFNTSYLIKKNERKNHTMKSINSTSEKVKKGRNIFDINNNYQSKDKDYNNDSTNKNNNDIKNNFQSKDEDKDNDSIDKNNNGIKNNYQSKEKDNNNDSINKNNNDIKNNYQSKDKDNNNDSINKNNNDIKNNYQSKDKDNINDITNKNNNNNISSHNNSNNNNQLIISTNNISNVNGNNQENKNNYKVLNVNNAINSRNIKFKNTNIKDKAYSQYSQYSTNKPNDMKYKYQIKEYNTNIASNNIMDISSPSQDTVDNKVNKEEDEIDLNKIIDEFNKNNNNIKQKLSRDDLLKNESLKLPLIYDSYFSIFKFLNNNEIYSYSSVNKSNGVCSLYYWMNYLENKITYLNDNYNKLSEKYKSLTQKLNECSSKSNSILSYFSKSGLRVLNSPHYLDIFNNPVDYFTKDNIFLFIYKMLFHFNKLYDCNNKSVSDNDFISFMQKEIKEKTEAKKSLKDYVNNVLDKEIDFSFEHVVKAKSIMKFYNIENIEGNQLTKTDRATTIIGYVVRDIMGFIGRIIKAPGTGPKNIKNKKVEEDISFSSLKNKIINVCEQINNEKTKCDNTIKKIKDLITKYYNI